MAKWKRRVPGCGILVGDSDELRGVAVDVFMVEDVSGPETCEEGGSVDIRVW